MRAPYRAHSIAACSDWPGCTTRTRAWRCWGHGSQESSWPGGGGGGGGGSEPSGSSLPIPSGGSWPVVVPERLYRVLKGPSTQPGWAAAPISVRLSKAVASPSELSGSMQKKASSFETVPSASKSHAGSSSARRRSQP